MRARRWPILFLSMGIVVTVLLSASLSGLTLLPGVPYFLGGRLWLGVDESELSPPSETLVTVIRIFFVILLLLLPVSIVYLIISPTARRQLLRNLAIFAPVLLLLWLIRTRLGALSESGAQPGAVSLAPEMFPWSPTAEFVAAPPQWLIWLTSFGLAALLVLVLVGIVWRVRFYRHHPPSPLMQLAQQAQEALDALQAGDDLRDTVMRCYLEMNRVLHERRGIRRPEAMTPREFEIQLKKAGLPGEHVQQLTRLFESVRYGAKVSSECEGQQAIACLTAIVETCQSSP